ncbi:uncharacterized protein N7482_009268 [Penicillium canariense]|uniref:Uncharacterized protein n=1 Tax=Penicillium canariense TaxID=189055 RepID=A0A9W9HQ23_9EURO|nr:uncharacterized protein N7482_009268 [Penicillium canariense]KAJ5152790.1 hypothetical protein N7482_009268 [Penicillium canariense]
MTFDDDPPKQIVAAAQDRLPIDGISSVSDPCLVAVANASHSRSSHPTDPIEVSVDKREVRALDAINGIQFVCDQ